MLDCHHNGSTKQAGTCSSFLSGFTCCLHRTPSTCNAGMASSPSLDLKMNAGKICWQLSTS